MLEGFSSFSYSSPSSRSRRRRDASSRPCRHRQHCAAEHLLETTIQDRLISSPLAAPSLPYHSALKIRKKSAKKIDYLSIFDFFAALN